MLAGDSESVDAVQYYAVLSAARAAVSNVHMLGGEGGGGGVGGDGKLALVGMGLILLSQVGLMGVSMLYEPDC